MILLESWINQHLRTLETEKLDEEENHELTLWVYNLAMKELVKQVYVECKERGRLIHNLWTAAIVAKQQEQSKSGKLDVFWTLLIFYLVKQNALLLEFEQKKNKELRDQIVKCQTEISDLTSKSSNNEFYRKTDIKRHRNRDELQILSKQNFRVSEPW